MSRLELEQKINDLLDEVYEGRIGMTRGIIPEIVNYPERMAKLSADVMALPDDDAVEMKALLTQLRDDLETMSWEMGEIARRLREEGDEPAEESSDENNAVSDK